MSRTELQLLGTGTAFHHDGRGSQCLVVRPRSAAPFLVDLGPTAMAAVMRYGVDTDEIDRLFLTHLHGDHVAGWPFLLLHLRFIDGRRRPLDVYGARGTRDCLEGLMHWTYRDVVEGPGLGFDVRYHELEVEPHAAVESGPVVFDVLPMDHHPSSIGYRFEIDGKRIAVSGDTRWCTDLERLACGSDLLLLECTSVNPHEHSHICLDEIRERVERLGGCEVVLVHLTDEVAATLASDPIAGVRAGYDGLILEV